MDSSEPIRRPGYIGQPLCRREDVRFVQGRGRRTIDLPITAQTVWQAMQRAREMEKGR